MLRRIVFIEKAAWLQPLTERFPGAVFASIDEFTIESLREKGLEAIWLPELLAGDDRLDIDREAWKSTIDLSEHPKLSELLNYRGIAVGSCGILQMNNCFVWALKIDTALRRLLEKQDFDEFVCGCAPEHFTTLEPSRYHQLIGRALELMGKKVIYEMFDVEPGVSKMETLKLQLRNLAYIAEDLAHCVRGRSPQVKPATLVSGALKQLGEIVGPLLANGHRLVYTDIEYRLAKAPYLRERNIPYYAYAPLRFRLKYMGGSEAKRYEKEWPARRKAAVEVLTSEAVLSFRGKNFYSLLGPRFDYFFDDFLRERRLNVDFFLELITRENVSAVVSDEDTLSFRKTLALCAKKAGAATTVICHNSTPTFLGHELMPLTSDRMSVGGPFIVESFSSVGIPKDQLRACGLPRYDQLESGRTALEPSQVRARLAVTDKSKVVVFGSTLFLSHRNNQRTWWEIKKALEDAAHCLAAYPDITMVVKFHPITDEEHMRRSKVIVEAIRPVNNIFIRDIDTPSLFNAGDLVFTFFSSVVTESMLLNKPTVILDYFKNERVGPFFPDVQQNGLSFIAADREGMRRAVDAVLKKEAPALELFGRFRSGVVQGWAGAQDGNSAHRIVRMIEELSCT